MKLSNTSVDKYIECSLCWYLHYIERIRPVKGKSTLLFGKALDTALNHLLLEKKPDEAKEVFLNNWETVEINGEKIYAPTSDQISYFKNDLDEELLEYFKQEDENRLGQKLYDGQLNRSWLTLRRKGLMFIDCYHENILPQIKEVIAIQEPVSLKNADDDEITGALDIILKWKNGTTYLMDNKSSSSKYAEDSAKTGQQLPLYYYIVKEKYKLDGVGYIVLSKKVNKNKTKKCQECDAVCGSGHKTCNAIIGDGILGHEHRRCGGKFNVFISPTIDFDIILNQVDPEDEERVIATFDEVNYNIKNGYFATEHTQKRGKYGYCPYKEYYEGNPDFIKLPKKELVNEENSHS